MFIYQKVKASKSYGNPLGDNLKDTPLHMVNTYMLVLLGIITS